jgi:energy-converting hydrogenase Eha subunit F
MNDQGGVDLYKYGKLVAQVEAMEKKIDKLESGMEELLELANKSKGGFWMGMTVASIVGGLVTFITSHWAGK